MAKAPKRTTRGGSKSSSRSSVPKKRAAAPSRPARSGSSSGYNVICSECYSEFSLASTEPAAKISCPECMHMGEVSTSDVMGQISMAKGAEKGWFVKAFIPILLMVAVGFAYIVMITREGSVAALGDALNYGMLGGVAILAIIVVALVAKYESNRYDVYF